MAMQTRIKQRFDYLSNWIQNDIVLLQGELAVVDCESQIRFKIGDGVKSFTQLSFVDQNQLCTNWLVANAISQGLHASSVPFGLAAGAYLCANANYSQALGYDAQTISTDIYSFVWNGDTSKNIDHYYNPNATEDYYNSHGAGSFSINPLSGLSGFYIGEQNLAEILNGSGSKVFIDDRISGISGQNDLSIIKLSADEYANLLTADALLSNVLYIIEQPFINVYGQQIKNLTEATDLSDAVILAQLQAATSDLSNKADISSVPLSTSQMINDSSFISSHQSLSNYYQKNETSSSAEISDALSSKADLTLLQEYYQKSETSSAVEISSALEHKSKVVFVNWED